MVAARHQPLRIESTAHRSLVIKLRDDVVRAARGAAPARAWFVAVSRSHIRGSC
jgi:hypothetical protein